MLNRAPPALGPRVVASFGAALVSLAVLFVAVLIAIGALLLLVPLGSLVRWRFRRELEWGVREYLREHRHGSEPARGPRR